MRLFLRRHRKKLLLVLSLCLVFLTGTGIGRLAGHGGEENRKFEAFTKKIFEKEVSGNMLNLHYSLAHPEKKGISRRVLHPGNRCLVILKKPLRSMKII